MAAAVGGMLRWVLASGLVAMGMAMPMATGPRCLQHHHSATAAAAAALLLLLLCCRQLLRREQLACC